MIQRLRRRWLKTRATERHKTPLSRTRVLATSPAAQVPDILKAGPDCIPALMTAAILHELQGDINAAKRIYKRILSRLPANRTGQRRRTPEPGSLSRQGAERGLGDQDRR